MDEEQGIEFSAQWMLDPTVVPVVVNQILLQQGPPVKGGPSSDVYLSLGHLNPPVFPGEVTDEVRAQFATSLLPIVPVARVVVSRDKAEEFRDALTEFLEKTSVAGGAA